MHKSPILRLFVALALLVLSGCGDPDPRDGLDELIVTLQEGTDDEINRAIEEVGKRGDAAPEVVVPLVAEALANYEGQRHLHTFEFRLEHPPEDLIRASEMMKGVGEMMPRRLRDFQYQPAEFRVDSHQIVLQMMRPSLEPDAMKRFIASVIRDLSNRGSVALMPIVTDPGNAEESSSLWKGDSASYREYLRTESKRLAEALAAQAPYEPKDPQYLVTMMRPSPGDPAPAQPIMVYRSPRRSERFEAGAINIKGGVDTQSKMIVLIAQVAKARLADMQAWSKKHHARLIGLLVDGDVLRAQRIGLPLVGEVIFPVGPQQDRTAIDWMRTVVRSVATGPYPAQVTGKLLPPRPEVLDLPLARALVRIGPPAEAALRKLERTGGTLSPVATWALREITRRASGQERIDLMK